MSTETKKEIALEIAHVLFIDIVGYSKLSINDQHAAVEELNQVVRATEQFQKADASERLSKIATGDGMALVFYTSPEAPVQCAVEISRALKEHPRLQLRMGIHSGPVSGVVDVNERANLAGAGLNIAERVMDCGDAGHILLSKHVAEDLEEYERWRPLLHDLGSCEVKHDVRVSVVNLYNDQFGNATLPRKFERVRKRRTRLRWAAVTAVLLAVAVIVAGIAMFSGYQIRSILAAPEKSIAVLPFENLSDARTDAHLWAEHYDRPLNDVFAIQSEVAQAIADQLHAKLSPEEKAGINDRPTSDLVAYDLYVRAEALRADTSFSSRLKENLLQATQLLEQAIARDPTFFLAYCRLAEAHDLIYFFGSDHTPARLALAHAAIEAALRLRPDSGEAHLALAEHL